MDASHLGTSMLQEAPKTIKFLTTADADQLLLSETTNKESRLFHEIS